MQLVIFKTVSVDLITLILYIVALIIAKKCKSPWLVLGIGAGWGVLSFIGTVVGKSVGIMWVLSVVLFLAVTAVVAYFCKKRYEASLAKMAAEAEAAEKAQEEAAKESNED